MMMQSRKRGHNLPPEYQEVEWIRGTGTQYIDLGISPSAENKYEASFIARCDNTADGNLCASTDGRNRLYMLSVSNGILGYAFGSFIYVSSANVSGFHRYDITLAQNMQRFIQDGQLLNSSSQASSSVGLSTKKLFLFCFVNPQITRPDNWTCGDFSLKVNDSLYCELYPCYRRVDNKTGMYDMANNAFRPNLGRDEFLLGPDV